MTSDATAQAPEEERIKDLERQNEVLRDVIKKLSPHLLDDERERSRAVWEAALYACDNAQPGQPGPWAVIAAALKDAEERGARKGDSKT